MGELIGVATPKKDGLTDKVYAPLNIGVGGSGIRFIKIGTSPTPAIVRDKANYLSLLIAGGNNYGSNKNYVCVVSMSARSGIALNISTILLGHPVFGYVINGNMVEWWIKFPIWSSPVSFFPLLNEGFTLSLEIRTEEPSGIIYFT